ncbi:MAG: L-gamma-glutamyl-L-propargylglycine hydroxylase [Chlamydiales bacterium]|nr:L-gamma-glutamyl-L-propargylglycine hydroxylase [Chlamydiales bacterium]
MFTAVATVNRSTTRQVKQRIAKALMRGRPLTTDCKHVVTAPRLNIDQLRQLMNGEISMLRVPQYASRELCSKASLQMLNRYRIEEYKNAKGVMKVDGIGKAYFETTAGKDTKQEYYEKAESSIELARHLFTPELSPLDRLRLELDERWPTGASLLNLGDGQMFCGLLRVLSGPVLAHEDKLERDHGPIPNSLNYVGQLAANVYLRTPKSGGELHTWNRSLETEEYDRLRGDSYGISPERFGPPSATITPECGDLIFFNPRNLHAITPSEGQSRITIATFILYGDESTPLRFWS